MRLADKEPLSLISRLLVFSSSRLLVFSSSCLPSLVLCRIGENTLTTTNLDLLSFKHFLKDT
jgi:hypothetical protein